MSRFKNHFKVVKAKKDLSGSQLVFEDNFLEKKTDDKPGYGYLTIFSQKQSSDEYHRFDYDSPLGVKIGVADIQSIAYGLSETKTGEVVKLYHQDAKNGSNTTVKFNNNDYGLSINVSKQDSSKKLTQRTTQLTKAEAYTLGLLANRALLNLYS